MLKKFRYFLSWMIQSIFILWMIQPCWSSLLGGGNKNPITMQNETHGGNESDAMVFRAWWCIVLLFRGLNLKWLCKMRILFFIFNKFEKVSFSFESEIYLLLKYANYNWIIESWLSEINWETRIFRQKILLILRNQFCLKWIILYLKKKKKQFLL